MELVAKKKKIHEYYKAVTSPTERAASAKMRESGKFCCVQERKS